MTENLSKVYHQIGRYEMEGMDSTTSGERVFVIKFADHSQIMVEALMIPFTRTGDPTPGDIATPEVY
jgi:hypothetical protein